MAVTAQRIRELSGQTGQNLRPWAERAGRAIRPGVHAWWGAAIGVLALGLALAVWFAATVTTRTMWLFPATLLISVVLGAGLVAALAVLAVRLFDLLPRVLRWSLITAAILIYLIAGQTAEPAIKLMGAGIVAAGLLGGGLTGLLPARWPRLNLPRRVLAVACVSLGAGLLGGLTWWVTYPGPAAPRRVNAAALATEPVAPLAAQNPAQPGPYAVHLLSYGSGQDRQRPEFGADAALLTQPVDGAPFVGGWDGLSGWLRDQYWGFDSTALPLNALVWYPGGFSSGLGSSAGTGTENGAGPFPLVLVVHGNHLGQDFSDPGYAYLCQLLASRGSICASVDENFLNESPIDLIAPLREENDARAWLLLEHLRQWRAWNAAPVGSNPFAGKVDLDRVALIGHSRGGEAAAVAAAFNGLPFYPDNAAIGFDYHFGIRSVAALAPIDGQYLPARTRTPLKDVNYLVLHGSYDGDVNSFSGWSQYDRVVFTGGDWFKAAVYIDRANHGQFNSTWGTDDMNKLSSVFVDRTGIMPEADQQQIAAVYLSAFMEATLHNQPVYRALFRDHRTAAAWLPDYVYITHWQDATYRPIVEYGEDIDLTTGTLPGTRIEAHRLSDWREQTLGLKWATNRTHVAYVGWDRPVDGEDASDPPSYGVVIDSGTITPTRQSFLVLDLADAGGYAPQQAIDLTVALTDRSGNRARLPLSQFGAVQLQLKGDVRKGLPWEDRTEGEPVLQRFELPLADFAQANPAFDATAVAEVRLVFDRTPAAVLVVSAIGVSEH